MPTRPSPRSTRKPIRTRSRNALQAGAALLAAALLAAGPAAAVPAPGAAPPAEAAFERLAAWWAELAEPLLRLVARNGHQIDPDGQSAPADPAPGGPGFAPQHGHQVDPDGQSAPADPAPGGPGFAPQNGHQIDPNG